MDWLLTRWAIATLAVVVSGLLFTLLLHQSQLFASFVGVSNQSNVTLCPSGMVFVPEVNYCVDQYEAGVGNGCSIGEPTSFYDTAANLLNRRCEPVSEAGQIPWRFVSYIQAEQLCARAGKTLIPVDVWYQAALGTPDSESCIVNGTLLATGTNSECYSGIGAFDMVGNVWEFVQNEPSGMSLSATTSGFVAGVSFDGLPISVATSASMAYGLDYYTYQSPVATPSITVRGGHYAGQTDAGIFSAYAGLGQDFSSAAIGFRCALSV